MPVRPFIRLVLVPVTCLVFAAVTSAQQQQPTPGDDVVRVSTELVQTDFMVFDKQGNFIDGLKSDQFVLKIDGKQHPIAFFDRIAAGTRNEEAQLAAARGTTGGAKPSAVPLDRGRTVMFFL